MSLGKKKNAQKKLVNELKNQLFIQAERLGIRDQYTPLYMEELKLDSIKKILADFYMERANLEYEMHILGSNKKEILIKLERLHAYIRKAVSHQARHLDKFEQIIEKSMGDLEETKRAVKRIKAPVRVQAAA